MSLIQNYNKMGNINEDHVETKLINVTEDNYDFSDVNISYRDDWICNKIFKNDKNAREKYIFETCIPQREFSYSIYKEKYSCFWKNYNNDIKWFAVQSNDLFKKSIDKNLEDSIHYDWCEIQLTILNVYNNNLNKLDYLIQQNDIMFILIRIRAHSAKHQRFQPSINRMPDPGVPGMLVCLGYIKLG